MTKKKKAGERVSAALVSRLRAELAGWERQAAVKGLALDAAVGMAEARKVEVGAERAAHATTREWLQRHAKMLDERKDEVIRLRGEIDTIRGELEEEKRKRKAALAASAHAQGEAADLRERLREELARVDLACAASLETSDEAARAADALLVRCGGADALLHVLARVSLHRMGPGRMSVALRLESESTGGEPWDVPPAETVRFELAASKALDMGTELHDELSQAMRRAMRIGGAR